MELLEFVLYWTNPLLALGTAILLGLALAIGVSGSIQDDDDLSAKGHLLVRLRRLMVLGIPLLLGAFYGLVLLVAWREFQPHTRQFLALWWREFSRAGWVFFATCLAAPPLARWYFLRFAQPAISSWLRRYRVTQSGDALSDIRVEIEGIKSKDFDPRRLYRTDQILLGVDDHGVPVYVEDAVFKKMHSKYIGPSQTGKGVGLGVLLDQCIRRGWGVWFLDIKPDDFIYEIMRESCEAAGRPGPLVLDLNAIGPGNYGPFINGSTRERRERVVKAFRLFDSGDASDFYKRNERAVLDFIMPFWDGSLPALDALLKGTHPACGQPQFASKTMWIQENAGSIKSNVSEFLQLESLKALPTDTFDPAAALDSNAVVYVRGHMKDTIVRKGSVALLDEVIQVALRRPLPGHTFIAIDEVRFFASDTLADSLATVLSKHISMGLAYQSLMDLKNLPDKSLNADAIKTGIETNTQMTISYRANDPETARWIEEMTGTVQKTVTKMEKVEVNAAGAEQWAAERSLSAVEEGLIPANKLLALPPRVAALIQPNKLATLLYTCWVPVKEFKGLPARVPPAGVSVAEKAPSPAPAPSTPPSPAPVPEASPSRAQTQETPLTAEELAELEGLANSLQHSGTQTRPDVAANVTSINDIKGI